MSTVPAPGDAIEARAWEQLCELPPADVRAELRLHANRHGSVAAHAIGGLAAATALNGIIGADDASDPDHANLDAAIAELEDLGVSFNVSLNPVGTDATRKHLLAHGFTPGYAWMKFELDLASWHPGEVPPAMVTVRRAGPEDGELFGRLVCEGFGTPAFAAPWLHELPGASQWHCFIAEADGEPAATGALFVEGDEAWVGIGATLPQFRQRGAQGALLRARIEAARDHGARRVWTETGEQVDGQPAGSYRNILRAGFHESYLRENLTRP